MAVDLKPKFENAREVTQRLTRYGGYLDDWMRFWPEVTEAFTRREQIWFGREGEGTWPALSETYAAWKAQVYPGKPLLVATGDLKGQLTDPAKAELAKTPRELVLGSTLKYAGYHQQGTEHMPARKPLVPVVRLAAGIARLVQIHCHYPPGFRK